MHKEEKKNIVMVLKTKTVFFWVWQHGEEQFHQQYLLKMAVTKQLFNFNNICDNFSNVLPDSKLIDVGNH